MTHEHRIRMLEHQTKVKAALQAHESGEGNWMSPTTTSGTRSGTAIAELAEPGSPSRAEAESTPGSVTPAVKVSSLLVKKLADVMAEAEKVTKRGHNDFHNYDYATESDISAAIRGGMATRGLMILPRVTGRTLVEKGGEKGGILAYVDMTFSVMDSESGDVLEFPWLGCGEDKGDKAIYKAFTGALKTFLLKLFLIPTGHDPEREDARKDKGKGKTERQQDRPLAEPPSGTARGDAAAILDLAAAIEQHSGRSIDDIIGDASYFKTDAGQEKRFSDPLRVSSEKWLKKVRVTLEKQLQGINSTAALGDSQAPF